MHIQIRPCGCCDISGDFHPRRNFKTFDDVCEYAVKRFSKRYTFKRNHGLPVGYGTVLRHNPRGGFDVVGSVRIITM